MGCIEEAVLDIHDAVRTAQFGADFVKVLRTQLRQGRERRIAVRVHNCPVRIGRQLRRHKCRLRQDESGVSRHTSVLPKRVPDDKVPFLFPRAHELNNRRALRAHPPQDSPRRTKIRRGRRVVRKYGLPVGVEEVKIRVIGTAIHNRVKIAVKRALRFPAGMRIRAREPRHIAHAVDVIGDGLAEDLRREVAYLSVAPNDAPLPIEYAPRNAEKRNDRDRYKGVSYQRLAHLIL